MVYVEPFGTYPRLLWPPSTGSYSPEKVIKASRISMVEFYVNGEVYVRGLPNALPLFGYYGQITIYMEICWIKSRLRRYQSECHRSSGGGVVAPIWMRAQCRISARATSWSGNAPCARMPTMASSCLEPRIGNRITDREMVDHLSLPGCQVEITVHLLI